MNERPYFASYYRWLVASCRLCVDLSGARLLDVGCDDASFLTRSRAGLRVGVDLAPRARPGHDIDIVRADARQLPYLQGSFECVLAFDVLEHIEDDRAVMGEMRRVLAPGGTIWFSTPAAQSAIRPRFLQPYANHAFGHVRNGYTIEQIQGLLPHHGWHLECFLWNEPVLRSTFVLLHALDRLAPPLADWLTRRCFTLDSAFPEGRHGHVFGSIRRRIPENRIELS